MKKTNRACHRRAARRTGQAVRLTLLVLTLSLMAGCTWLAPDQTTTVMTTETGPKPTSTAPTATSSPTTPPSATSTTTETTTTTTTTVRPTPTPMTTTVTAPPTTALPTPVPTITTTTTVRPTPTPPPTTTSTSADLSRLSLDPVPWWYNRPKPTFQDVPATIPDSAAKLVQTWSVIWQAKPTQAPTLYLTMDEGYEYEENTREILDIAREKDVPIAFFITGTYLRNRPDLVRRMVSEGHLVLNHTDHHPNLAKLLSDKGTVAVMAELDKLADDFATVTGSTMPRLVRPPEGTYSERLLGLMKLNGYRAVFWSFAYRDWITDDQPDPEYALDLVLGELHDGSVLLLHAVSDTNVAILPQMIDAARKRGYRFGKLTEIP